MLVKYRYLDRIMETSFFHESKFEGLLAMVKHRSRISSTQKMVHDQVNMLFSDEGNCNVVFLLQSVTYRSFLFSGRCIASRLHAITAQRPPSARPMTLLTPAVTPPPPEEAEQEQQQNKEEAANTDNPTAAVSTLTKQMSLSGSRKPPPLAQAQATMSNFLVPTAHPGSLAAMAGSAKSSFDSSCWSKVIIHLPQ